MRDASDVYGTLPGTSKREEVPDGTLTGMRNTQLGRQLGVLIRAPCLRAETRQV